MELDVGRGRMKLLPIIVALALAQLALAGCSTGGKNNKPDLTKWPLPGWETNNVANP